MRRLFKRRTDALIIGSVANVVLLLLIGVTTNFAIALVLLVGWALVFALESPLRQAFINGLIPSEQRATVLSFDSLTGSVGALSPAALGRSADVSATEKKKKKKKKTRPGTPTEDDESKKKKKKKKKRLDDALAATGYNGTLETGLRRARRSAGRRC